MTKNALVIGYGSIGQRHAKVLAQMGVVVGVLSRRSIDHNAGFKSMLTALEQHEPDYVVIANSTSDHMQSIRSLAKLGYSGKVLVEKPLFDRYLPISPHSFDTLNVAYNLRFHPLISRLRRAIEGQNLLTVQVYVGQYLPDWRPDRDYRESYSAHLDQGGGVLRDLSHDLDYVLWMLGGWQQVVARGGQRSSLEITSDDCFGMMLETPRCDIVSVQLNYLDRTSRREILVNTDRDTFKVDLVRGCFSQNDQTETVTIDRNHSYMQDA